MPALPWLRGGQRDCAEAWGPQRTHVEAARCDPEARFLRQNNLRKSDVDGVGLALLDTWARAQAKVELLDGWFAQHGVLDGDGKPQPALALYFTALNAATKTLKALDAHLKRQADLDPFDVLSAHLASKSGDK